MDKIVQKILTGERALFQRKDVEIEYCIFADGESPLKESQNIKLKNTMFKWKYPLWYTKNIEVNDCTLFETARSGIWYTTDIVINNSCIEAPKTFRRSKNIILNNVSMPNALETFWNCENIKLFNVIAKGDYFGLNSQNIEIEKFEMYGNYTFDGCKNIVIRNAKMLSKDAFWNCENVTVFDSFISGEYLGWNSKNITFVNCTIESLQGMCYMDNVKLVNCRLINTTLAFEYSNVNATIKGNLSSIFNPKEANIKVEHLDELIFNDESLDLSKVIIEQGCFDE